MTRRDAGQAADSCDTGNRGSTADGGLAERTVRNGVVRDLRHAGSAVHDEASSIRCRGVTRGHAVRHHVADRGLRGVRGHAVLVERATSSSRTRADRRGLLRAEAVAVDTGCRDSVALRLGRGASHDVAGEARHLALDSSAASHDRTASYGRAVITGECSGHAEHHGSSQGDLRELELLHLYISFLGRPELG
ncbi:hypothetical protein D3C87_279700 [compost metagenome]